MADLEIVLEWVTVKGNRYALPVELDIKMETLPFMVDAKLGAGHLELNGEPLTWDMEPPDDPVVVNVMQVLVAKGLVDRG